MCSYTWFTYSPFRWAMMSSMPDILHVGPPIQRSAVVAATGPQQHHFDLPPSPGTVVGAASRRLHRRRAHRRRGRHRHRARHRRLFQTDLSLDDALHRVEPSAQTRDTLGRADRVAGLHPSTHARNIFTTLSGNAFAPIAALLTMPILSYSLGVDGRGQVAAATAPLILATTAATFGIPEAVTYLVARTPTLKRAAARRGAWLIFIAGLLATAGSVLVADTLAGNDPTIAGLIVVASTALAPSLIVLVIRGGAAGSQRWRLVAAEQATTAGIRLAAISGLALGGWLSPLTATISIAFAPVIGGVVYLPLRRPRQGMRIPDLDVLVPMRHLLGYGSRVWIGSLSGILLARLDQVIMIPLSNAYELGLYAVAVGISEVILILNLAVRDVTFASDAASRDDGRLCASARISGFLSICLAILLAAALPIGIPLLFGADFAPAVSACFWLLAAVALSTSGAIAGAGLSARGRPGLRSMSLLAACVINVIALIVLVPEYGAVGAAIATFVGNLVASGLNLLAMWKVGGLRPHRFYGLRRSDVRLLCGKACGAGPKFLRRSSRKRSRTNTRRGVHSSH